MADQTNAEVSDERLREIIDAVAGPFIAVPDATSIRLPASELKALVLELITRRSVTSQASEGAVAFELDPLGVGAKVRAPGHKDRGTIADIEGDEAFVDYSAGGGSWWPRADLQPWENWRDTLGRAVRVAWVKWAQTQPSPKASWLVPYDELSEPDKEADRQIGEALTRFAAPVSKRVERLETANRALAEIKESFRIAGLGTIGAHWQTLIDTIDQALQGGRS